MDVEADQKSHFATLPVDLDNTHTNPQRSCHVDFILQALCSHLNRLGEEYFVVTASKLVQNKGRQLGSREGKKFLHHRPDVVHDFDKHCCGSFEGGDREVCVMKGLYGDSIITNTPGSEVSNPRAVTTGWMGERPESGCKDASTKEAQEDEEENDLDTLIKTVVQQTLTRLDGSVIDLVKSSTDQGTTLRRGEEVCVQTLDKCKSPGKDSSSEEVKRTTSEQWERSDTVALSNITIQNVRKTASDEKTDIDEDFVSDLDLCSTKDNKIGVGGETDSPLVKIGSLIRNVNTHDERHLDAGKESSSDSDLNHSKKENPKRKRKSERKIVHIVDENMCNDTDVDDNKETLNIKNSKVDDAITSGGTKNIEGDQQGKTTKSKSKRTVSVSQEESERTESKTEETEKALQYREVRSARGEMKYKCLHCNFNYANISCLRKHFRNIANREHNNAALMKKKEIQQEKMKKELGFEYAQDEEGKTKYKCLHCGYLYASMNSLRRHYHKVQRRTDTSLIPADSALEEFSCRGCGKGFTKKQNLMQHQRKVESCNVKEQKERENQDLSCLECDEHFSSLSSLKNHCAETDHLCKTQCPLCNKELSSKESLKIHVKNVHGRTVESSDDTRDLGSGSWQDLTQCPFCKEKFPSENKMMKHLKSHRDKFLVQCTICNVRFVDETALSKHMRRFHSLSDEKCEKCQQKFKFMFVFHEHDCTKSYEENMKIVNDKINGDYICYVCKKNHHNDRKGYWLHLQTHTSLRPYKCDICGKDFKWNTNLTKHLKKGHSGRRDFMCDLCGRSFAHNSSLKFHIHETHGDGQKKKSICPKCGKELANHMSLAVHMRTHSSSCLYVCETCGKGFHQKGNLQKHTRMHSSEKAFKCERCDKDFKYEDYWKTHMRRHLILDGQVTDGKTPYGRIYTCQHCNKLFPSHTPYKIHLRTHTNERPYPCDHCTRAFKEKGKLQRHMKTHGY